jgi:beta-N-acetylhexosaminidase
MIIVAAKRWHYEGHLPLDQINDSVRRLLTIKMQYRLFEAPEVDATKTLKVIRRPEFHKLSRQAAKECMSVVRDEQKILPVSRNAKIFVTTQHNWPYYNKASDTWHHSHMLPEFFRQLAADPLLIDDYETELKTTEQDELKCLEKAAQADVIVAETFHVRSSANNAVFIKKLLDLGKPLVLVSNYPYEWISLPEAKTLILTFSCMPRSMELVAEVVYGITKLGSRIKWPLKNYKIRGVK